MQGADEGPGSGSGGGGGGGGGGASPAQFGAQLHVEQAAGQAFRGETPATLAKSLLPQPEGSSIIAVQLNGMLV